MSKKEILKQLKPYIRSEYRSVGKGCNHESYILDRDFKYIVDILQCASQEDKRRIEELETVNKIEVAANETCRKEIERLTTIMVKYDLLGDSPKDREIE